MFGASADTLTRNADRLLKPAAALASLRPLSLSVIASELRGLLWLARGLDLVSRFFPANLPANLGDLEWSGVLRGFLLTVEEHWFPVDWAQLDYLFEYWMSVDDEDGEAPMTDLAEYLEYIPVKFYNYGEEALLNAEEAEWYTVLVGLVSDRVSLSAGALIALEIYDNLAGVTRAEILDRLYNTDEFAGRVAPLCHLPALARMAACATGNPLLDGWREGWESSFGGYEPYRWDRDIDEVRDLWAEARPVVEMWNEFDDWCRNDRLGVQKMVWLLLGSDEDPDDNGLWLDQAAARQNDGGDDDE